MAVVCARCGEKQGMLAALTADLGGAPYHCDKCLTAIEQEKRAQAQKARERHEMLLEQSKKVLLTTTPTIEGCRITRYVGIDSVEFVIGTGVLTEMSGSLADFFGARSKGLESKLREAKDQSIAALKYLAAERGANAVVAVDMDYTEFSSNRVALILNGTLVVAERVSEAS